jgi:hypothetical protein
MISFDKNGRVVTTGFDGDALPIYADEGNIFFGAESAQRQALRQSMNQKALKLEAHKKALKFEALKKAEQREKVKATISAAKKLQELKAQKKIEAKKAQLILKGSKQSRLGYDFVGTIGNPLAGFSSPELDYDEGFGNDPDFIPKERLTTGTIVDCAKAYPTKVKDWKKKRAACEEKNAKVREFLSKLTPPEMSRYNAAKSDSAKVALLNDIISERKKRFKDENQAIAAKAYIDLQKASSELRLGKLNAEKAKNIDVINKIKSLEVEIADAEKQILSSASYPWLIDISWLPEGSPDFSDIDENYIEYRYRAEFLNDRAYKDNYFKTKQNERKRRINKPSKELLNTLPVYWLSKLGPGTQEDWNEFNKLTSVQKDALIYRFSAVFGYIWKQSGIESQLAATFDGLQKMGQNLKRNLQNTVKSIVEVMKKVAEYSAMALAAAAVIVVAIAAAPAIAGAASAASSAVTGAVTTVSTTVGGAAGAAVGGGTIGATVTTAVTGTVTKLGMDAVGGAINSVVGNIEPVKAAGKVVDAVSKGEIPPIPSTEDIAKAAGNAASAELSKKLDAETQKKLIAETEKKATQLAVNDIAKKSGVPASNIQAALDGKPTNVPAQVIHAAKQTVEQTKDVALVGLQQFTGVKTGAELPYTSPSDITKEISAADLKAKGFAAAQVQANLSNSADALGVKISETPDISLSKAQRQKEAELVAQAQAAALLEVESAEIAAGEEVKKAQTLLKASADRYDQLLKSYIAAKEPAKSQMAKQLAAAQAELETLVINAQAASKKSREASLQTKKVQLESSTKIFAAGQGRYKSSSDYAHPFVAAGLI